MDEKIIFKTVNDFLSERIDKEVEREKKRFKVESLPYEEELAIREKYGLVTWLNRVADNASQVSLNISHVAKLTHSSSKASNVTDSIKQTKNLHLLTTQTAEVVALDLAYTNATLAPIAEFLSLNVEGATKSLGEFLAEDTRYLTLLSDDEKIREGWRLKIAEAYQPTELSSHVLAKQVYFPLNQKNSDGDEQYHLLSPVKSSALAHKIYLKVREAHDAKAPINIAHKNKVWSEGIYTSYPKMGILSVTKSNHQNASKLNGARSGNLSLFCATPPVWLTTPKSTYAKKLTLKRFFFLCYQDDCAVLFKQLKNWLYFLEKDQAYLNAERKIFIAKIIQEISETVFNQILLLHVRLESHQEKLEDIPIELRPFLMSHHEQDEIGTVGNRLLPQAQRAGSIDDLIQATVRWVSDKIGDKTRATHYEKLWAQLMQKPFREFYAVMEAKQ